MKHITHFLIASALLISLPQQGHSEKESKAKDTSRAEKRVEKKQKNSQRAAAEKNKSNQPAPPRSEKKSPSSPKRTFLGVATSPVSSDLREHLEIAEGFGIQIQDTIEGSPARKAGLKRHDILVQFEDQKLISPEHLSLLVRTRKSGDSAELTLIRKGKEIVKKVTLGETDESLFAPRIDPRFQHMRRPHPPAFDHRDPEKWQEYMKQQQDQLKKWFVPKEGNPPRTPGGAPDNPLPRAEGRPPAVSVNPGFPVQVLGSKGIIKIDNQEGELTISQKEGKHKIELRDKNGKLIHEGDFDPKKGIESLPSKAQEHLKTMKLENLEVLAPKSDVEVKKTSSSTENSQEPSTQGKDIL